jgi:ABC-type sugar transport system substrate-binding protein
VATGAKPAASLIFPWVADAAISAVRQLSTIGPVIMITQEPNEKSAQFVKAYAGANQQLIGKVAGEMLLKSRDEARKEGVKLHSKQGNLLVFQHPEGEKTGVERWKGFEAATKDAPFKVLGTEYGANDPETGYEKGSQVIPRFKGKGIDFLYVSNQQAANGVIRALKENGIKPGKDVKIVSSDCSGSLEAVKNGETFGTGLQSGAIEGQLGVATAARYIATKKVEGDVQQFKADPKPPTFEATPPAKLNYMPHAAAIGPEGIDRTKIWGYTAEEICAGS